MSIIARNSRVAGKFSGPEAAKLLNDVLSGTVREEDGPTRWWALLTPQGKIVAEGLLGWHENAFWLDVAADVAADFFKRMRMYKLRAQVEIADLSASHAVGWSGQGQNGGQVICHEDPRAGGLGFRTIAPVADSENWLDDETEFAKRRIAMGIAELGPDFGPGTFFAHDIAMDLLGGVDFTKGCYVGQEVVSRMQHRATARRRPVIVAGIAPGSNKSVTLGGREVGKVGQVVEGAAVGFLRLDRITSSGQAYIGDKPVSLAVPQWASYGFG